MTRKFAVQRIVVHKTKTGKASTVDLALLKLTEEIDLTKYTPLCLPDPDFDIRGHNVTLTGEGEAADDSSPVFLLQAGVF